MSAVCQRKFDLRDTTFGGFTDHGKDNHDIIQAGDMCGRETDDQPQSGCEYHHHHKEPRDHQQNVAMVVRCDSAMSWPFGGYWSRRSRHVWLMERVVTSGVTARSCIYIESEICSPLLRVTCRQVGRRRSAQHLQGRMSQK
jgi:hypothetical protein